MTFSLELKGQKSEGPDDGWPELQTSLKLLLTKTSERLLQYSISFTAPNAQLHFSSKEFVLYLSPVNELENLAKEIDEFLKSSLKVFRFEPNEPNFELVIERANFKTFKLYFWVDGGNAIHHSTWDGIGLRLFLSKEELNSFTDSIFKQLLEIH